MGIYLIMMSTFVRTANNTIGCSLKGTYTILPHDVTHYSSKHLHSRAHLKKVPCWLRGESRFSLTFATNKARVIKITSI